MAVVQHTPINPERMVDTALAAVEETLVLPNVGMQKESIDQFKGAANGAVNVKVEGVLPYREYGWRNDRSQAIQFDAYAEEWCGTLLVCPSISRRRSVSGLGASATSSTIARPRGERTTEFSLNSSSAGNRSTTASPRR